MRIFTSLASLLTVALAVPALAQTELNTRPPATPSSPVERSTQYPAPAAQPSPESRYRTSSLGIDLGWGGPYGGLGFYYAHLLGPGTDINAGFGIGVGGKLGIGVRHFFSPAKALSPYIGANLSRSGRIDEVRMALNEGMPSEEIAYYNLAPSGVLNLRSGLRWQPGRVGLLGTLGYGILVTGNPVSYTSGQYPSRQMQDLVDVVSPGGLEITLGMSIGLGQ